MKEKGIAIVGGGPAGLFAALHASLAAKELGIFCQITIFERNERLGIKLLSTGGSQCNITRNATVEHMLDHYGEHGKFLRHALHELSPDKTMAFFEQMGLPLVTREDDKVFPASFKARDVLGTLLARCTDAGITFHTNRRITSVQNEQGMFQLYSEEILVDTVNELIISTGGKSYPRTGSTGDGYTLAKSLGHSIITPKPALCAVAVVNSSIGNCSGISIDNVGLSINWGAGKRRYFHGPLLVTHTGLSGPLILDCARYLSSGDTIEICWVPHSTGKVRTQRQMEDELLSLCNRSGSLQVATIIHRMGLPTKFVHWLLQEANIDGDRKAAEVGRKVISPLAKLLAGQEFTISLKGAFPQAMVTAGGVALEEIDPKTMQSKIIKGLYFAGEVVDIDGDTGGYNLQAAWSTGALAGNSAIRHFT